MSLSCELFENKKIKKCGKDARGAVVAIFASHRQIGGRAYAHTSVIYPPDKYTIMLSSLKLERAPRAMGLRI